jgi:hypothetical protein
VYLAAKPVRPEVAASMIRVPIRRNEVYTAVGCALCAGKKHYKALRRISFDGHVLKLR